MSPNLLTDDKVQSSLIICNSEFDVLVRFLLIKAYLMQLSSASIEEKSYSKIHVP